MVFKLVIMERTSCLERELWVDCQVVMNSQQLLLNFWDGPQVKIYLFNLQKYQLILTFEKGERKVNS